MVNAQSTQVRSGARWVRRSGFITMGVVLVAMMATARPAAAGGRAKLSRDLQVLLATNSQESTDVILCGTTEFVARIAQRHGASIRRRLATCAVLTVSASGLRSLADDAEVGAVTGDGEMRSQLALVTESTGAADAWAGEIAQLGAVIGKGIGVAIIDSGVDAHTALAGRIVASVDFTRRTTKPLDEWGHGTHVAGIVAAGAPKVDSGDDQQADLVEIISSDDPGLALYGERGYALTWTQLRIYTSQHPEVRVAYVRGNQWVSVRHASDRPELVEPVPVWREKLLLFRPVDLESPERCVPLFGPAR